MTYCKKQIDLFQQQLQDLTQQLMTFNLPLFAAVKNLLQLNWHVLFLLVSEWQRLIHEAQLNIQTCSECGSKIYTRKVTHPLFIFPFGRVSFVNRKVRCSSCSHRTSLLSMWIPHGLGNRITPLVGEMILWLSAMLPYREVCFYLKQFWHLDVSVSGVQSYTWRMGRPMLKHLSLLTSKVDDLRQSWSKVHIYVDGVMVFINNRWQEVKVGIIECHKGKQVCSFYHAAKTDWESFLTDLREISRHLGCDEADVHLFLSDAGKGITSHVGNLFQEYQYLIDYFHATEHISTFLSHLGLRSAERLSDLRSDLTSLLYKGHLEALVSRLESLRGKKSKDVLRREIDYFRKHTPHFDYVRFRQHKWPIGSGKIESACRWLIQQRFKLSGMRWKDLGFELILGLRLGYYNNRLFNVYEAISTGKIA